MTNSKATNHSFMILNNPNKLHYFLHVHIFEKKYSYNVCYKLTRWFKLYMNHMDPKCQHGPWTKTQMLDRCDHNIQVTDI